MSMTISANQLMMQMGQMKIQAHSNPAVENNPLSLNNNISSQLEKPKETLNFGDLMASAVNHVNDLQSNSGQMKKDFEMGKGDVDLVQVMIAGEKASVAFTALMETRRKLMMAYNEIKRTRV